MKSVARRILDRSMLHLIKMWLEAKPPVEEKGEDSRKTRTTTNWDTGKSIPQGSPISPLVSNLYMEAVYSGMEEVWV